VGMVRTVDRANFLAELGDQEADYVRYTLSELSANRKLAGSLANFRVARDPGIIRKLKEPVTSSVCRLHSGLAAGPRL
jgi:hypothetical protein